MGSALEQVKSWPATGATAGVVVRGDVRAMTGPTDRSFPWASVTKLLTSLAVLVAIEEGTLALDEPAGPPGSTVRHLLAHASGLPMDGTGPLARPGTRRIYSNTGFEVLTATLARRAGMTFAEYLSAGVLEPLGLEETVLTGSPASGASGPLTDLLALGQELLVPTLVSPEMLAQATSVAFPHLSGILPGFGRQDPNDWGLGFELRDGKSPHWTGARNSSRTFGHFGQSGSFLWVDPEAGLACGALADREFGPWAAEAWPRLADAVLDDYTGDP
ncbi:MAG TPA: serine hydrolase domain-containing protein [Acidimicrobiales bacterium]|nr:serine hydrolase domain-containing protein [Acidimicrobiales bacterium]